MMRKFQKKQGCSPRRLVVLYIRTQNWSMRAVLRYLASEVSGVVQLQSDVLLYTRIRIAAVAPQIMLACIHNVFISLSRRRWVSAKICIDISTYYLYRDIYSCDWISPLLRLAAVAAVRARLSCGRAGRCVV
eukprot:2206652-Pleurochrysis_carterae.AAC.1